jgi:hypothetical protein
MRSAHPCWPDCSRPRRLHRFSPRMRLPHQAGFKLTRDLFTRGAVDMALEIAHSPKKRTATFRTSDVRRRVRRRAQSAISEAMFSHSVNLCPCEPIDYQSSWRVWSRPSRDVQMHDLDRLRPKECCLSRFMLDFSFGTECLHWVYPGSAAGRYSSSKNITSRPRLSIQPGKVCSYRYV